MALIDFYSSQPHYGAHMWPVYAALPEEQRGAFGVTRGTGPVVVASYGDYKRAKAVGYTRFALMQHGAGQSYGDSTHSSYPGGGGQGDVSLFLCPNEYSAAKWRQKYPNSSVVVAGSPATECLPVRESSSTERVVAVSFHWRCSLWPETMPAFGDFRLAVAALPYSVIGHGHPRAMRWLRPYYAKAGIPVVEDWAEVCKQADVYVCDNSSTIFEFAATGRPVVLMNSRHYRKRVNHGGRFWEWATVGLQVDHPDDLADTVKLALLDPRGIRQERRRIVQQVYAQVQGSTQATVNALLEWAWNC